MHNSIPELRSVTCGWILAGGRPGSLLTLTIPARACAISSKPGLSRHGLSCPKALMDA